MNKWNGRNITTATKYKVEEIWKSTYIIDVHILWCASMLTVVLCVCDDAFLCCICKMKNIVMVLCSNRAVALSTEHGTLYSSLLLFFPLSLSLSLSAIFFFFFFIILYLFHSLSLSPYISLFLSPSHSPHRSFSPSLTHSFIHQNLLLAIPSASLSNHTLSGPVARVTLTLAPAV